MSLNVTLWPCKVLCVASCRTNKLSVQLQSLKRRTQHRIYISISRSASIYKCKHVRSLIQLFIICSACILFSLSTVWYFCRRSSCIVQTSPLRSIKCFSFWSRSFPDKLHFHSDILSATWAWNLPRKLKADWWSGRSTLCFIKWDYCWQSFHFCLRRQNVALFIHSVQNGDFHAQ